MSVFDRPAFDHHEEVAFFADPAAGLRAIVAIHDSAPFGMAGGGCRVWPYDDDQAAIDDVLRLSKAMTYKLALADLPAGGAKMVVIADPHRDKTEALLRAIGRAVQRLNGRFVVGTDVGTDDADLAVVAEETVYVSRKEHGRDTAKATAFGVFLSTEWAARRHLERPSLDGVRVALQGTGRVGALLAHFLADAGARLVVTDVDEERAARLAANLNAQVVSPDAILGVDADVFAPCALGGVLDEAALPRLKVRVVVGAANNPLADDALAGTLADRGVLFVPDFVANLGGVIGASPTAPTDDEAAFLKPVEKVVAVLDEVAAVADDEGGPLQAAATTLAQRRLAARKS